MISREDALERIERLRQELAWLVQKYETQHATQTAPDVSLMVPFSYGTRVRQRSTGWLGTVLRWHDGHSKWLVRFDEVGGRFVGHEDLVEVGHEDLVEEEQRRPRGEPHPGQAQRAANRAMRLKELREHDGGGPDMSECSSQGLRDQSLVAYAGVVGTEIGRSAMCGLTSSSAEAPCDRATSSSSPESPPVLLSVDFFSGNSDEDCW